MKTILILILGTMMANAQLGVTVSPPKISGQKAAIPLAMKNHFTEKIECARAAVFLLDENGKMVGQATKWVIGEVNTNGLAAGATNVFNFIVSSEKSFATTNLTAKVSFIRVVLEGGKLANASKDVTITTEKR